jgi:protein TonB
MRGDAEASRKLGYAVAASIAVHAFALFGVWPTLRESLQEPPVPPPLVTRLVELPKAEEAAPAPPIEEKKPAARPRETRKAEPPKPSPAPPMETAREPTPPAPPSPQAESATATAQEPAPPPQADSRAAEAATAAQYRMQLIAYAQRNKPPYPRLARENNWVGEVTLEITLRADGQAELGLRRASGHEALDKLALDTYQQALRAVPVPPALRGRPVRLQPLRVIYNLTE